MIKNFIFTSESVTEGHPDKLCDQISDAIVDFFLNQNPHARVRAECAVSSAIVFIAARIRSKIIVNPDGPYFGGPTQHSGLTGRKNAIDTYGEFSRHSGKALSGKDPLRIDRVGAYAARYAAKNVVAAGLDSESEILLSYSIGSTQPVSLQVQTFGTGRIDDKKIARLIQDNFDFRLAAILRDINLRHLSAQASGRFYQTLAAYGHFGRAGAISAESILTGIPGVLGPGGIRSLRVTRGSFIDDGDAQTNADGAFGELTGTGRVEIGLEGRLGAVGVLMTVVKGLQIGDLRIGLVHALPAVGGQFGLQDIEGFTFLHRQQADIAAQGLLESPDRLQIFGLQLGHFDVQHDLFVLLGIVLKCANHFWQASTKVRWCSG